MTDPDRAAHFHAWRMSANGCVMNRRQRAFRSEARARADAAAAEPDPERRAVMPCRDPECAPE